MSNFGPDLARLQEELDKGARLSIRDLYRRAIEERMVIILFADFCVRNEIDPAAFVKEFTEKQKDLYREDDSNEDLYMVDRTLHILEKEYTEILEASTKILRDSSTDGAG